MQHVALSITTPARTVDIETGTQLGERGAEPGNPSEQGNPAVATRLAASNPAKTVESIHRSVKSSHGIVLAMRNSASGPQASIASAAVDGVKMKPDFPGAIQTVQMSLTPAPISSVQEWLAGFEATVAKKNTAKFDAALQIRAYSEALAKYPADVVRYVLTPGRMEWWPPLSKLTDEAEHWTAPRRKAVSVLRDAHEDMNRPAMPEPTYGPQSDEAKARAQEAVDTLREDIDRREAESEGDKLDAWREARDRKSGRDPVPPGQPSPELLKLVNGG